MKIRLVILLFLFGAIILTFPVLAGKASLNLALLSLKNAYDAKTVLSFFHQSDRWDVTYHQAKWYEGYWYYVVQGDQQKALEIWSRSNQSFERLIWSGRVASRQRNYIEALKWFNYALDISPESARAWYFVGGAYLQLEEFDRALFAFQKAVQYKPDESLYLIDYAHALIASQADLALAENYLEQALLISPPSDSLFRTLASLAQARGDIPKAVDWLEKAVREPGRTVQTLLDLAGLYNQLGQPEAALPYVQQAVIEAPHSESAQQLLEQTLKLLHPL